jgi:8-oxo-dGTP pyrophosphatase MutT (NUDIX family)
MEAGEHLRKILLPELGETRLSYRQLISKLDTGRFLRAHDVREHFCVLFLPYEPTTGQVLVVHHKKAELWLFPGGHIEPNESPTQTLNREIEEELGLSPRFPETTIVFMFSVTSGIRNVLRECRTHYDVWFLLPTDPSSVRVDQEEFFESRWADIDDAKELILDRSTLSALNRLESHLHRPGGPAPNLLRSDT